MNTKYCHKCETDKSVSSFRKRKTTKDGLQTQCSECMDAASEKWRRCNTERKRQLQLQRLIELRDRWREYKHNLGCKFCDEDEPICLDHHHTGDDKKDDMANLVAQGFSWKNLLIEAAKGIIVCSNCHRKVHGGILTL